MILLYGVSIDIYVVHTSLSEKPILANNVLKDTAPLSQKSES